MPSYTAKFRSLLNELQRYLNLQKRYVALDAADKLIVLLTTIAVAEVCFVLGAMLLFFLTFALALWIGHPAGSTAVGFLVIAALLALALAIFNANRKRWVLVPISRLIVGMFSSISGEDPAEDTPETEKEEPAHE